MARLISVSMVASLLVGFGVLHPSQAQKPDRTLEPKGNVSAMAFSPAGDLLVVVSGETVRLWDTGNWRVTREIKHPKKVLVSAVAFSPDGALLATGPYAAKDDSPVHSESIRLWNVNTGEVAKQIPILLAGSQDFQDHVPAVRFSPDGNEISFIERLCVRFYDVSKIPSDKSLSRSRGSIYFPSTSGYLCDLAFSPDGKWFSVGDRSSILKLWNFQEDPRKYPLPNSDPAATSQERTELATDDDQRLRRRPRELYRGQGGELWSLAFTPDSAQLVVADFFTIRVVDLESGKARTLGRHLTNDVRTVVVSADGKYVASAGGRGARLWRLSDGALLHDFVSKSSEYAVAFSPDSKLLALETDGVTQIWGSSD